MPTTNEQQLEAQVAIFKDEMRIMREIQEQEVKLLKGVIQHLESENQKLKADLSQAIKDLEAREQQVKSFMDLNKQLKAACAVKDEALQRIKPPQDCFFCYEDSPCSSCLERARMEGEIAYALSDNSGQGLLEEVERLREAVNILQPLSITAGNANAISYHLKQGDQYGGLTLIALTAWLDSLAQRLNCAQQALNPQKKGEE